MRNYIILDKNNLIIGVMQTYGKIDNDQYIEINNLDYNLMGSIYQNGNFSEEKYIYDTEDRLVNKNDIIHVKSDLEKISLLEQLVADLAEIVLLGGGA